MKYTPIIVLLLPAVLWAQEFQFRQEVDSIPLEIGSWSPFCPWMGGFGESAPALADIDDDGDLDMFFGYLTGDVAYAQNVSSAVSPFFDWIAYRYDSLRTINSFGRSNPDFADLDADGDYDCVIGSGYVTLVENMGSPMLPSFTSTPDTLPSTTFFVIGTHVALVDIDADSDTDIICGEYQGNLQFYGNIGTPDSFAFYLESNPWLGISVGAYSDPTFCDIDADGDFDLFIGNEIGRIYFYRNDGTAQQYNYTFVTNYYDSIDVGGHASPEFADIDGDGDYDLFVGRENMSTTTSPGDIFFYDNVGTPQVAQWNLVTKNYISLDMGYMATHHATDIDADSDHDLFIMNDGDSISFYQNIGTPSSASFQWITDAYQNIQVHWVGMFFSDIDADYDPDLFIGEVQIPNPPYPGLYLFQNRGTPQSASFSLFSNNFLPGNYFVCVKPSLADIDADGDNDIFLTDNHGYYYFYENTGTPTLPQFSLQTNQWQGLVLPGSAWSSSFYDIDDDGDLDLFLSNGIQLRNYLNMGTPQVAQMVWQTDNFLGEDHLSFGSLDIFDVDADSDGDFFLTTGSAGMVFYRNITGEASAPPPVQRHPQAGLQISLGPNPANPFVVASFELRVASNMSLDVFDLLGRRVAELASGFHLPGEYRYVWDAGNRAAGMYIIRLKTPQQSLAEKLTIIK
ncbi:MAG TPA: FG-GAP-like repeat-containing protein [bacterium]